ncbi:hypothetical protein [Sphingobium sp. WCS2017Hpa-17]|uniref:hypothetical protein n=1 Tax=Sphingobium sp. WCS2017Hpa-17 TaxID=3073638 RepID=UPI00288B1F37|nr:hypothetical protein [Sphingobium sp. WCS2017Hpa-17]
MVDIEKLRERLGQWRPESMTTETAPEWLKHLSPADYAARRNDENASSLQDLRFHKDWLTVSASWLCGLGQAAPSEFGSYGHHCLILSDALVGTRDQIIALLDELERKTKALEAIELLATNHGGWLETDPRKLVADIHAAASAALKGTPND